MKKIRLGGKHGKGKFALVDDEDFEELNKYMWFASDRMYAVRCKYDKISSGYKKTWFFMHRVINKTPHDKVVDHINGDVLDNRKVNLRNTTHNKNMQNRGVQKNNKVGLKGVSITKYNFIRAQIRINRKTIHLGNFRTVELAFEAYKKASRKYFGEYSKY